ncbi:MAG: hypothetical protein RL375_2540 [Pseudomonadota bacterium]
MACCATFFSEAGGHESGEIDKCCDEPCDNIGDNRNDLCIDDNGSHCTERRRAGLCGGRLCCHHGA